MEAAKYHQSALVRTVYKYVCYSWVIDDGLTPPLPF